MERTEEVTQSWENPEPVERQSVEESPGDEGESPALPEVGRDELVPPSEPPGGAEEANVQQPAAPGSG